MLLLASRSVVNCVSPAKGAMSVRLLLPSESVFRFTRPVRSEMSEMAL